MHEPGGARGLVVTRAREVAAGDATHPLDVALRAAGVELHEFALIELDDPADVGHARAVLDTLERYALAIPVSPSAVRAALRLRRQPWPRGCAVGLIGAASREAFERELIARGESPVTLDLVCAQADASGAPADSEALWQALRRWRDDARPAWSQLRVLILRGDGGRDWLADTLRAAGAAVDVLEVYRRVAPAADARRLLRLRELLALHAAWQIGAASALHNLCELLRAAGLQPADALASQRALVQHPRVAQAAREAGFGRVDLVGSDAAGWLAALAV